MSRSFGRGLWSLIRRVFDTPKGRHVIGVAPAPDVEPGVPVPSGIAASGQALSPVIPATTGLASIQLIFTDGSVVALPESSVEGRQAQYLARRVLEAGRPS